MSENGNSDDLLEKGVFGSNMFAFLGSEPGRRGQGQRRINSKRTVLLLVTAMLLSCLIFDAEQSLAAAEKVPYTVSKASTGVKFKVASKGLVGTCAQAGTKAKNGTATLTKLSNSSAYAKVAYYYGVKKGWDKESASSTQYKYLMLMMQYISDRSALRGWNSYTQKLAKDYLSTAKSKAKVPDTFEIYKANPGNASQDFVAWKDTKPVKVKLLKKSTDAGISSAGGYSFDAAMLGAEYSATFHADGSCQFVMAGYEVPGVTWSAEGDTVNINYALGYPCTLNGDALELDFSGAMLLHMEPQL